MNRKRGNDYIIKSTSEWEDINNRDTVIPEGCICLEVSENNSLNVKIGDGKRTFFRLPYISNESVNLADYAKISYVDEILSDIEFELPVASTDSLGGVQSGSNIVDPTGLTPVPIIDGIPYYESTNSSPAGDELGLVKSGGDIDIINGEMTIRDGSHNHAMSEINELQDALDSKVDKSDIGSPNGIAELDDSGRVLSSQLPSYVDAIIEGYFVDDKFYRDDLFVDEIIGEASKIYIDVVSSRTYRWSGERFVLIAGDIVLGETSTTAYRGDRGKTAFDHSQFIGNPHGLTKADIGLGNVDNVSTNDQILTYTKSTTPLPLISGEKLTTSLGKIAKSVDDNIDHINNNLIHVSSADKTRWDNKADKVNTGTASVSGTTKLYNTTGDNSDGAITQMALTALLDEKTSKSTVSNVIVSGSGWNGDDIPYTQTVSVVGVTQSNMVEVTIPGSITNEQLTELVNAQVNKVDQSTDAITLYSYGTKPSINIPITVVIRGDI